MGVDYFLEVKIKEKVDIEKIINFFQKKGFKYLKKNGVFIYAERKRNNLPFEKMKKTMRERGGRVTLVNKENNSFAFGYHKNDKQRIILSRELSLLSEEFKKLFKQFIQFMEENYSIEEMEEVTGPDERGRLGIVLEKED